MTAARVEERGATAGETACTHDDAVAVGVTGDGGGWRGGRRPVLGQEDSEASVRRRRRGLRHGEGFLAWWRSARGRKHQL